MADGSMRLPCILPAVMHRRESTNYTTYENHQITAVDLYREELDGTKLFRYPLDHGGTDPLAELI